MASMVPDAQCIQKHGIIAMVLWTYSSKRRFILLLLQLGLVGFSWVTRVRFNFSDKVCIGLLGMKWVELCVWEPMCRHSPTAFFKKYVFISKYKETSLWNLTVSNFELCWNVGNVGHCSLQVLSTKFDHCKFITLSAHLCLQHVSRDAEHCAVCLQ